MRLFTPRHVSGSLVFSRRHYWWDYTCSFFFFYSSHRAECWRSLEKGKTGPCLMLLMPTTDFSRCNTNCKGCTQAFAFFFPTESVMPFVLPSTGKRSNRGRVHGRTRLFSGLTSVPVWNQRGRTHCQDGDPSPGSLAASVWWIHD